MGQNRLVLVIGNVTVVASTFNSATREQRVPKMRHHLSTTVAFLTTPHCTVACICAANAYQLVVLALSPLELSLIRGRIEPPREIYMSRGVRGPSNIQTGV